MAAIATASARPAQRLFPTRLYNTFAGARRPWDVNEMLDAARRRAGLEDWGDDDFREGLEVLLDGLNQDRKMTAWGRTLLRRILLQRLTDKLEIQRELVARPELLERPVLRPIIIVGPGRTGTTLLQRLLALDPYLRAPRYWELTFPTPAPDPRTDATDPRIGQAARELAFRHYLCPGLRVVHPMAATAPDECLPLMERALFNPVTAAWFDVPGYFEWCLQADHRRVVGRYLYHRTQLQLMQGDHPHRRWILKAPLHGFFLRAVAQVYPDATFVVTHRDSTAVLASLCSLVAVVRGLFHDEIDLHGVGRFAAGFAESRNRRLHDALCAIRPEQIAHVEFDAITRRPLETLQRLYPQLGVALPEEHSLVVKRFLESQVNGNHTRHRYELADFGLDSGWVEDAEVTDSMALSY